MGPYADTALWAGISICLLILFAAAVLYWRARTGPHSLEYPSDEAYYAAKSRGMLSPEPGRPAGTPAGSREGGRSGVP